MRTLVVVGRMGPLFTGITSRYSRIGTRFDFTHYGDFAMLKNGVVHEHWLLSNRPVPAELLIARRVAPVDYSPDDYTNHMA